MNTAFLNLCAYNLAEKILLFSGLFFGVLSFPSTVIIHEFGHIVALKIVIMKLKKKGHIVDDAITSQLIIFPFRLSLSGSTKNSVYHIINSDKKMYKKYALFIYALGPVFQIFFLVILFLVVYSINELLLSIVAMPFILILAFFSVCCSFKNGASNSDAKMFYKFIKL